MRAFQVFAEAVPTDRVACGWSVLRGTRTGRTAVNCTGLAGFRARGQPWGILFTYRDVTILYFPAAVLTRLQAELSPWGDPAAGGQHGLEESPGFKGTLRGTPQPSVLPCVGYYPLAAPLSSHSGPSPSTLPAATPSVLPTSREVMLKPSCACLPLSLIPTLHPSPDRLSAPTLVSPLYENTSPCTAFLLVRATHRVTSPRVPAGTTAPTAWSGGQAGDTEVSPSLLSTLTLSRTM